MGRIWRVGDGEEESRAKTQGGRAISGEEAGSVEKTLAARVGPCLRERESITQGSRRGRSDREGRAGARGSARTATVQLRTRSSRDSILPL